MCCPAVEWDSAASHSKLCNTWVLSCQHQLQILARGGADRSELSEMLLTPGTPNTIDATLFFIFLSRMTPNGPQTMLVKPIYFIIILVKYRCFMRFPLQNKSTFRGCWRGVKGDQLS